MAACLGAQMSLNTCAYLRVSGSNPLVLSSRQACASVPIKVRPLRIAKETRRAGVVFNAFGFTSSVEDETPVKDTGVRELVDQHMGEANEEFAEMDLQEAAEKYSLEEQLFTEVDYAQVHSFSISTYFEEFDPLFSSLGITFWYNIKGLGFGDLYVRV